MTPKASNLASKLRIRQRRRALIEKLGGKCAKCGEDTELEFHHKFGRTWISKEVNRRKRMKLYEEDFEQGKLQLLCKKCHKRIEKEECREESA